MIFSNVDIEAKEFEKPSYTVTAFAHGRLANGRRALFMPCTPGMEIKAGFNRLSAKLTRGGGVRITKPDTNTFAILSSDNGKMSGGYLMVDRLGAVEVLVYSPCCNRNKHEYAVVKMLAPCYMAIVSVNPDEHSLLIGFDGKRFYSTDHLEVEQVLSRTGIEHSGEYFPLDAQ